MMEQGNVIVDQGGIPDPPDGPRVGPLVAVIGALAAIVLLVLGFTGDPTEPESQQGDPEAIESGLVPQTAATTTTTVRPTPSTIGHQELPLAVLLETQTLTAEDLAAGPALRFQEVPLPAEMSVVSHVADFQGSIVVFGPVVPDPLFPSGLQMATLDGDSWGAVREVVPAGESARDVEVSDTGIVVLGVPGSGRNDFGPDYDLAGTTVYVSRDGRSFSELPLLTAAGAPAAGRAAFNIGEGSWIFGSQLDARRIAISDAAPEPLRDLLERELVDFTVEGDTVVFFARALGFPLDRIPLAEFGDVDGTPAGGAPVAWYSSYLAGWAELASPADNEYVIALGEDAEGAAAALTIGFQGLRRWDASEQFEWQPLMASPEEVAGFAVLKGTTAVTPAFGGVGPRLDVWRTSGRTGFEFDLPQQIMAFDPQFLIGADDGVAVVTAPPFAPIDPPEIVFPNGDLTVRFDLITGMTELLEDDRVVIARGWWEIDNGLRLEPETGQVQVLGPAGEVAATVPLGELALGAASAIRPRSQAEAGGVIYSWDTESWGYVSLADIAGSDIPFPAAVGFGEDRLLVATGELPWWYPTDEPARLFVGTPEG